MADLTGHVMINKWDDDINQAITEVGGDTSDSSGLPDYADIIRNQLVSNQAVGEGIYQEWLFGDHTTPNTNVWEEPTSSTNAPQSVAVAQAIHSLYNTMALTARYIVLLVDEIPKDEINLSAIYLVKSTCGCEEHSHVIPNTYNGCYFVKEGKKLRKVIIPDFEIDLNQLFYLTREEYQNGFEEYTKSIEETLRKKFGKYWDDEEFALDDTLDQIVEEIQNDLQKKSEEILAEVNRKTEEALQSIDDKFTASEENLNNKFNSLQEETNTKFETLQTNVDTSITDIQSQVGGLSEKVDTLDQTIKDIDASVTTKFEELDKEIDDKLTAVEKQVNDSLEASKNELDEKFIEIDDKLTAVEKQVNDSLEASKNELDEKFTSLQEDVQSQINAISDDLVQHINDADAKYLAKNDVIRDEINDLI